MHIALVALLLKLTKYTYEITPEWVLIWVKFDPIQEIGPKVEGGHSFLGVHSFTRLQYMYFMAVASSRSGWVLAWPLFCRLNMHVATAFYLGAMLCSACISPYDFQKSPAETANVSAWSESKPCLPKKKKNYCIAWLLTATCDKL